MKSNKAEGDRPVIPIGVIGCGKIAQLRHLPEYAENPAVKIHGLYDLNMERAEELAKQYGAKAYQSLEAMINDAQIHAISVCSANNCHAEHTVQALRAGKDVLCEKPMATTLADCERMVEAANQSGRFLMIDQNQRLAAAHVKGRELIRAGAIGKPLTFRTSFGHGGPETWTVDPGKTIWFFDKKRAAMGVLADLGIHKTDLIQFLLDQTVVQTTATLCTLDKKTAQGEPIDVEDNAICLYHMDGGAIGTMTASWTHYAREDNSTVICGTKGELRLYDDPAHSVVLYQKGVATPVCYDLDEIQTNDAQSKSGVIDLFVEGLLHPEKREMTGESVLKAMRAVFASIESSQTGRTIHVHTSKEGGL
ncbi:MAG: Gfo/Idh/MocA family oxidoreductase [Clostridia bacterium]